MSLNNEEVLDSLTNQLRELDDAIKKLTVQLDSAKAQYLKVSGAVDVLTQIQESNRVESEAPEVVEEVPEVVEEPTGE